MTNFNVIEYQNKIHPFKVFKYALVNDYLVNRCYTLLVKSRLKGGHINSTLPSY